MKRLFFASLILLASLTFAFANEKNGDYLELDRAVKEGNEASMLLLKTLGKNLKERMSSSGVLEALEFCSMSAATLTANVDSKLGDDISIKRVTLKPRNPANSADREDKDVLEYLENIKNSNIKLPKYVMIEKNSEFKYYKPLVINKGVCLKCHGSNISKEVKDKISSIYPTDKAIGYKMGDLRGAIVVTVKK